MRLGAPTFGVVLGAAVGCSATNLPREKATPKAPVQVTLSILATNDVHGQLEKLSVFGGYVANLRRAREEDGAVVLVDAGDAFQGTIESNLNEGKAVIAAYNALGYAGLALGNHEFDFGPEGPRAVPEGPGDDPQGALKERLGEARFPVLSANLVDSSGARPGWKNLGASALVDVRGVRVGLVGLLTADAAEVIKRPLFENLRVEPLAATAAREAALLRKRGADVVVVIAHAGGACRKFDDPENLSSCDPDSEIFRMARDLPPGSVDAIIGGHRNAAVAHVVSGVPVAHAPSNLVAFSRVDLVYDTARRLVVERRVQPPRGLCATTAPGCDPGEYEGLPVARDAKVEAAIGFALEAARTLRQKPLGVRVAAPFPVGKGKETALGNLFADLMREAVPDAAAAFGNAGSVRDVLPGGELTYGELHHVMPFDNELAKLKLTGAELEALVRNNLGQSEHGMISISGVTVRAVCRGPELVVTLKRPDGTEVRDEEPLVVATSDFLALGGDGLVSSIRLPKDRTELLSGTAVLDAFIRGLSRRGSVSPDDPALYDPERPRMDLPSPPPVRCSP